jgi:hypothetical protein
LKAKTAFESGNSPPKVSESGALIQTGRGLDDVKRRILAAFERVHLGQPAPVKVEKQPTPVVYTEDHRTRFHEKAKRLSVAALASPYVVKAEPMRDAWMIEVPSQSFEEIVKEALGENTNE